MRNTWRRFGIRCAANEYRSALSQDATPVRHAIADGGNQTGITIGDDGDENPNMSTAHYQNYGVIGRSNR